MDGRGGPESDSTGELLRRKKMVGYRVTFERTNRETMPGKVRNRLQKCIRVGQPIAKVHKGGGGGSGVVVVFGG